MFGTSPNNNTFSYFGQSQNLNAPRLSRYRTDFEEVEFLVSHVISRADQMDVGDDTGIQRLVETMRSYSPSV